MNAPLTLEGVLRPAAADQAAAAAAPWAADFPILARPVRARRLAYLDNGATTQKPQGVIQALADFYEQSNANIHRGVHWLSQHATDLYEQARSRVAGLLNAPNSQDVIFVRGTTEAINLVAQTWGQSLAPGDEILVTDMEHHSNIVPWQLLCARTGAVLRHARVTDSGEIDLDDFRSCLNARTRLVALAHVSNALGTVNPVAEITRLAREAGALVLVDGAQAVAHAPVDVQALDCDFYAFSGHKIYGPTGIGALYVRASILQKLAPWQGGGDMIHTVSFEGSTWAEGPQRFEAGTPNIAGAVALGAAIDYVQSIGLPVIAAHESALLAEATERMLALPGVRLVGTARHKAGILSFLVDGIHPHDLGTILDTEGVAIRAGHHCAMPLMARFGIPGTARASLALYNTQADIDALVAGVRKAQKLFGV
ncbi:cysteine desulfurase [Castellaniella sp.]|uniref:cysteine desulfurase n=1 Tax=Castellaniella sp. TaxID=1955812 RepID=UPI003565A60C